MSLTVGTDTYISLIDADAYHEGQLTRAKWEALADLDKEAALRRATWTIDRMTFIGSPVSASQPLQWPRALSFDQEGRALTWGEIPKQIVQATAELALWLVQQDTASVAALKSKQVGDLRVEYHRSPMHLDDLPGHVRIGLRGLLKFSSFNAALVA